MTPRFMVATIVLVVILGVGFVFGLAIGFPYGYYSGWYGGTCALIDNEIAANMVSEQSRCTDVQRYPFLATPTVPTPGPAA
ncbi:MAG: hypothetical protein JOZ81_20895 [Chloroflexi bacterium]|nr:hypothetical protein [Chloroflexota bacterium]